jgi:hypothetical protein
LANALLVVGERQAKGKHGFIRKKAKKIQELHAKEVGVGNPSEERASS